MNGRKRIVRRFFGEYFGLMIGNENLLTFSASLLFENGKQGISLPSAMCKTTWEKSQYDNDDPDDVHKVDDEDLGRGDVIKSGDPFVPLEVFLQPPCTGKVLKKSNTN